MNRVLKRYAALVLAVTVSLSLLGCEAYTETPSGNAEPTDAKIDEAATPTDAKLDEAATPTDAIKPVTIRMFGFLDQPFLPFIEQIQEEFPEIRLEYEYQWDESGYFEMERRMLHQDGADIFVTQGNALKSMADKGLLLDITKEEFSTRYHISIMSGVNDQGRVYGLPLPTDLQCIIANRGLLKEHGINELPKSFPELIEICKALGEQGQPAFLINDQSYLMLLRTYWMYGVEGYEWMTEYNNGKAKMAGTPADTAWQKLEELIDVSGCDFEDTMAVPAAQTDRMVEEKYAFRVVNIANLKYMQQVNPELDLAALPFLGETEDDQWVYYFEPDTLRFFGASAELDKPENKAKKEAVLKIMDWVSGQEAQQLLASSGGAARSYVSGVDLEQGVLMEYLNPVIEQGHLTNSEDLQRGVRKAIADSVGQMLVGEMTALEAAAVCDAQNASYAPTVAAAELSEVIGSVDETIYWRKPAAVTIGSPMSQLAAEAMAEAFPEADMAFSMAKNVAASLYKGDITLGDVLSCAIGEEDTELVLVRADGKTIRDVMEMGIGEAVEPNYIIPYGIAGAGRLLHPVGLTYEADVTREKGNRITSITMADGKPLDMETEYTIICSGLLVDVVSSPNFADCQVTKTGLYLRDVLEDYIRTHGEISAPKVGFTINGAPQPLYRIYGTETE